MKNKKQVFNNMINSLKAGGKIAISYQDCLPPFEFNAYMLLNPENGERICNEMYQCETKTKIEHYCSSVGFQMVKHDQFCASIVLNPSRVLWSGTGLLHTAYWIFRSSMKSVYRSTSLHTLAKMGSLPWISAELKRNPLCTDWWPSSKSQTPDRDTMDEKKHLMIVFCLNVSVAFTWRARLCNDPHIEFCPQNGFRP